VDRAASAVRTGARRADERVWAAARGLARQLPDLNREVWLVASLLVIAGLLNFLVSSNRMLLGFYTLPTILSAYLYGRRHATLTALASALVVVLTMNLRPEYFTSDSGLDPLTEAWLEIVVWGGILILTGYAMGTLYEHKQQQVRELRRTYQGVLMILQQFIAKDKYTQNHSYRVSVYASRIGEEMGLDEDRIEDIRSAALLHDIGKLDTSRDILYKAARLSDDEYVEMKQHVEKGVSLLRPIGGSLRRILPIVLSHHDKFDGTGYHPTRGEDIPLEARIISVADVYDALTSDRPYRAGMSPFDAKETIAKGAGSDFDPEVVEAFLTVFARGRMDIPDAIVV
jgi:putative nucleotidyltransferase with HDIG domain